MKYCLAFAICFVLAPARAQDGLARRLDLDFAPARVGMISMFVGDTIIDSTSAVNWTPTTKVSVEVFSDQSFQLPVPSADVSAEVQLRGKGKDQKVLTTIHVNAPGTFYVLKKMNGIGRDDGAPHRYGFYWTLQSRWPVINKMPAKEYAYGEIAYVNFAAGHPDYSKYSFAIYNDMVPILEGRGPLVDIDTLWKSLSNLGVPLTLRGYYDGKPFRCLVAETGTVMPSEWRFVVNRPDALIRLTMWLDADSIQQQRLPLPRLDLMQQTSFLRPAIFRFSYSSSTNAGYIFTRGTIQKSRVIAEPAEFLSPEQPSQWITDGVWNVLELNPNRTFLRRLSRNEPAEVSVTIEFTDEFGSFRRQYKALVYEMR